MFNFFLFSLVLILGLCFRVVILAIDSIIHSHFLFLLQGMPALFCFFDCLSLLVVMPVSPSDDIVISWLFGMEIAVVVILFSEAHFLEVALIVVSATDDIKPLEDRILVLFLPDFPS